MTMSGKPRARLHLSAAQEFRDLHRRLAGALQFNDPDRICTAGDRQAIVEDSAGRAGANRWFDAQDLEPHRCAIQRLPGLGGPR